MSFRYKIITPNYCEAMELFKEYGCKGTFSCSNGEFKFNAEFEEPINRETLGHYNSKPDFSIKKIQD